MCCMQVLEPPELHMQQYYYGVPFGDCSGGGGVDNLAVTPLITRHMTNIVVLVAASKSTTEATTLQSGVVSVEQTRALYDASGSLAAGVVICKRID